MKFIIKNATVITQNATRDVLYDMDVLIEDGIITRIDRGLPSIDHIVIDARNTLVTPGIINTHVHLGETVYAPFMPRRIPLDEYLKQTEMYAARVHAVENARQTIASYSLLQLIRAGTTTVGGGRTAAVAEALGIRNVSGYMLMQSQKLGHFSDDITAGITAEQNAFSTDLTSHALFIHSLHTVDKTILPEVARILTSDTTIRLMVHVAESTASRRGAEQKWGMSEIDVLKHFNLLSDRTHIVHGNHLTRDELRTIRAHDATLAHCPSSNMNTADQTLSLRDALAAGIQTTIATDGVVTGGSFNALHEASTSYHYHNRFQRHDALSAQQVLDMITINAATALGLAEQTGSIEVGKAADITIHTPPFTIPSANPVEQLIYYAPLTSVRDVFINGRHVLADSQLTLESTARIEQDFHSIVESIVQTTKSS